MKRLQILATLLFATSLLLGGCQRGGGTITEEEFEEEVVPEGNGSETGTSPATPGEEERTAYPPGDTESGTMEGDRQTEPGDREGGVFGPGERQQEPLGPGGSGVEEPATPGYGTE